MGLFTIFKYFGLAEEAIEEYLKAKAVIDAAKDSDSPGGSEITDEEMKDLIETLDSNFGEVLTRVLQEFKIPVERVDVQVVLTD